MTEPKSLQQELERLQHEFDVLDDATSVHGGPPLDLGSLGRAQAKKADLLGRIKELKEKIAQAKTQP